MANKRSFKRSVETATAMLCNEMMLEATVAKDETRSNEIEKLVAKLLHAYQLAIVQCSVKFDKGMRCFESGRHYNKERRTFYRKMYERIAFDYNKTMNECIEKFKTLLK